MTAPQRNPIDGDGEHRLYRQIVDEAFDLRVRLGRDGRVLLCPADAAKRLGYSPDQMLGQPLGAFVHPKDAALVDGGLERLQRRGGSVSLELRIRDAHGHWRRFEAFGVAAVAGAGETLLVGRELRGRRAAAPDRLRDLSPRDALTGLPVRPAYLQLLERALARAERESLHLAVFVVDLDRFALVNDELGRGVGDAVLVDQATRLSQIFSGRGELGRGDGDEFIAFAWVREGVDEALMLAHDVRGAISAPVTVDGKEIFSTASVGIALYPVDGRHVSRLVDGAVAAMHQAKRGEGDCHAFFGALSGRKFGRLSLDAGLRNAVSNGELELFYQPLIGVEDHRLIGCEALVRWRHPEHGLLMPDEFLEVSEETGTILSIGAWVLRTACEQVTAWRRAGLGDLRLAVNVSARQLREERFADLVTWVLSVAHLDARALTLEITESVAVRLAEQDTSSLRGLRNAGVDLAIDDFGMGHASLSYLKHLPVNQVKIDKAFVQGSISNVIDAAIVRGIITMAREMELRVVAEGVETEEHAAFIREAGCHEVQGYLYAPPLSSEDFARFAEAAK
ncbi:MAG: GGDEF domain-containing protein [bacterium]|nr:GGDEF domain-containing protein [bacterium]